MKDKIYFASDFHLGTDGRDSTEDREIKIVKWLESIKADCKELYLLGDIFDYWYEYREVIPKGYVKFVSTMSQMLEDGTKIYLFTGNHDMWMFGYFTQEMGIPIYKEPIERKILNHHFVLGHGDGLGPSDHGYKFIKKIFANPFCQWLFKWIHPDIGIRLMRFFSHTSREWTDESEKELNPTKEWLISYCESYPNPDIDYFIFGHRHLVIDYKLQNRKGRYINLGDWLHYCSYAIYDGKELRIEYFIN